jgi:hypothetical protein
MKRIKILLNILTLFALFFLTGCKDEPETNISGFALTTISLNEGNSLATQSLRVQVKGVIGSETVVSYQLKEGTAKFGQDLKTLSGELKFMPGQTEAQLSVEIFGDQHLELTENFEIILAFEGQEHNLPVEIIDDDKMEAILTDDDGFYTSAEHPSMQLTWTDEFTASQLNTTHWTYEIGNGCDVGICGWGNNELEKYTNSSDNSRLQNGKLIITAHESVGNFTSARIKTQEKVKIKYGRIDVRAKLPKGQGIWPAIWMLGDNITSVGWPACGEIDIMELVGHEPSVAHGTVHYNNAGYKYSSSSTNLTAGDFSDKFHVFSIVWDKNTITWYVDNQEFKIFTNTSIAGYPFNNSFFFILNVAVGGNWPGPPDETTVFPQEMVVDYVRVFQ